MSRINIVALVQGTLSPDWTMNDSLFRSTWGMFKHPNVKIIPYYGVKTSRSKRVNVYGNSHVVNDKYFNVGDVDSVYVKSMGSILCNAYDDSPPNSTS